MLRSQLEKKTALILDEFSMLSKRFVTWLSRNIAIGMQRPGLPNILSQAPSSIFEKFQEVVIMKQQMSGGYHLAHVFAEPAPRSCHARRSHYAPWSYHFDSLVPRDQFRHRSVEPSRFGHFAPRSTTTMERRGPTKARPANLAESHGIAERMISS